MVEEQVTVVIQRAKRQRLVLIHGAQILLLIPIMLTAGNPAALWPCALLASALCCVGTDSDWRWLNRLLITEAVIWLSAALIIGVPS